MADNVTPIGPPQARPRPKLCPLSLIGAALKREKPLIAAPMGLPDPEVSISAFPCIGSDCAGFLSQTDPDGKIVGGGCAPTLLVMQVSQGVGVLGALLAGYELRRKGH